MWTINYKGFYIHGYCDKDECAVHSKLIPAHDAAMCKVFA